MIVVSGDSSVAGDYSSQLQIHLAALQRVLEGFKPLHPEHTTSRIHKPDTYDHTPPGKITCPSANHVSGNRSQDHVITPSSLYLLPPTPTPSLNPDLHDKMHKLEHFKRVEIPG